MHKVINIIDALNTFKSSEDGTYSCKTHEPVTYNIGYQVSFVRPEAYKQLNAEEWDLLTTYYCNYFQSDAHIGVYCHSTEVSFHSMNYSETDETMRRFNQESVLDWTKKVKYPNDITRWLIMNRHYDESRLVNYHEILKQIQ